MLTTPDAPRYRLKKALAEAFHDPTKSFGKALQIVIVVITILSVAVAVLTSIPRFDRFDPLFLGLEYSCAVFFMVEFVLRLWTSEHKKAYVFSFWGFVDMLSFVPIIISLIPLPAALLAQQMKVLLVVRTFRIAKVTRSYIEGLRASGDEGSDLNVKVYFLALFSAAIGNGAVLYAIEGNQPHYATMPRAILEVMKIFMGTAPFPTQTLWGELFIVVVRFEALCLLGLLIEVMGSFMRGMLFGHGHGAGGGTAGGVGGEGMQVPKNTPVKQEDN